VAVFQILFDFLLAFAIKSAYNEAKRGLFYLFTATVFLALSAISPQKRTLCSQKSRSKPVYNLSG